MRKLALVCLNYNICFKAKHVPGLQNKLADSLSRLQLQIFKQLAPAYMHKAPTVIPPVRPFSILVSRQPQSCPVELLAKYLAMRGPRPGALFITVDGAPVSRSHFSNQLSSAIQFCGLSPSVYKGHSFRIGAASHAADKGLSDAQIRLLGRWKSNAFLKYLRTPSLCS